MEVLDKADNIELQYFKDEVKKYKKQEAKIINDMEKMKKDYEDAMKRLENIELENKKIVSLLPFWLVLSILFYFFNHRNLEPNTMKKKIKVMRQ